MGNRSFRILSVVTYKRSGRFQARRRKTVIESNVNKIFEGLAGPKMRMTANNSILGVGGSFDTPILNGAVFHQSTFNNLFIKGLSATIGLRLDYEKIQDGV